LSLPNQAPDFGEALVILEYLALVLGEMAHDPVRVPIAASSRNRSATVSTPP
jgi:hypothetical protein